MRRSVIALVTGVTLAFGVTPQVWAGPAAPPGKPENVIETRTMDIRGNIYLELSWQPPSYDGGAAVTGYEVLNHFEVGGVLFAKTSETRFGLGVSLKDWPLVTDMAVRAVSGSEVGPLAGPTTRAVGEVAHGVQNITVNPGIGSLTVSWNAAVPGTYPLAGYSVYTTSTDGKQGSCWTTSTSCTVENLVNGVSYSVEVVPQDIHQLLGYPATADGTWMVGLVPKPPTAVAAVAKLNRVKVTWNPPASDGGLPITAYRVKPSQDSATCETKSLSCTMTLAYGSTNTFTVTALNAKGASEASLPSKPVTVKKPQTPLFDLPKTIKRAGTTVLLDSRIITNAGQKGRVAVTVEPKKYAKVNIGSRGRTTLTTSGGHRVRVTLRVWAPATAEYEPYELKRTWIVRP